MASRQSGVATEIHLAAWSEPAKLIVTFAAHIKGGLGKIVLRGDRLHQLIR